MNHFRDIIPVSLFKKDTKEYLTKVEVMRGTLLLTLNGRGAFVLQHVNTFMQTNELAEIGRHSLAVNGMLDRIHGEGR